jgi:hypothetical protein
MLIMQIRVFMHAAPPVLQLLLGSSEIMWNDICPFRLLLSSMKTEVDIEIMLCQFPYMMVKITSLSRITNTSLFPWLWVSLFPYARAANTNVFRFVRSYVPIGILLYFWLNCVCNLRITNVFEHKVWIFKKLA